MSEPESSAVAPAKFVGLQEGFGLQPQEELYNLHAPVGPHPAGSTVSRTTLEKHGYTVFPDRPES
jgi:hypothetical protein